MSLRNLLRRTRLFRAAVPALVLALMLVLAACAPEEEDELSGAFGPGSGGTPVNTGAVATLNFNRQNGGALGSLESDTAYFPQVPAAGVIITMPSIVDSTVLVVTWIFGRQDTPCRYYAAVDARDNGFEILGSGDRTNDNNLEFHQVNLVSATTYRSYYCTILRDNAGIMIVGDSPGANRLGYRQVHFVLNSIAR